MSATMAQNGNVAKNVSQPQTCERKVLGKGCGAVKAWWTRGSRAATREGTGWPPPAPAFALAARRPCERAVRASTDMGKSAQTAISAADADRQPE